MVTKRVLFGVLYDFKNYLILLLVLFHSSLFAQKITETQLQQCDSLRNKLKADSLHIYRFQKYRPYVNIDQRNSFIRNAPIKVNGIQLGTLVKEKHVIGLGGYAITTTSKQKVKIKMNKNIDVHRELDMNYLTFFYQYVAIDKRYFELDFQAEFGVGKFDLKLYDFKTNNLLISRSAGMLVSGVGPILVIKPLKWIGITGMAGYRFCFEKNTNLNFNGVFYSYGVWLDIRQIIRDVDYHLVKKRRYRKQHS